MKIHGGIYTLLFVTAITLNVFGTMVTSEICVEIPEVGPVCIPNQHPLFRNIEIVSRPLKAQEIVVESPGKGGREVLKSPSICIKIKVGNLDESKCDIINILCYQSGIYSPLVPYNQDV